MKKLLLLWIVRRWIRKAQRSFDSTPPVNDGMFNTAGFQSAVYDDLGMMPGTHTSVFLLDLAGARVLRSECHWLY